MVIYPFIAIIKTNFFTDDEGAIIVLVSLKRRNILVKHVKLSSEIQVKSSELRFVVTISRRDLLKGASFGLSAGLNMSITRAAGLQARVFDVVIVGGGTAGIPTAIFAALSGANVLVVEKTSNLGGTLLLSTGQIAGSGTIFQQRAGIVDSPDAHYDDIMRINRNTSDQSLTRLTVDNAGATINWLADHGFEILPGHPVTGIGHDHFRIARYLQGVNSGISILQAFLPTFQALASKGKITVITESEVVELVKGKSGEILGVVVKDASNRLEDFHAANTVLASGGCAANARMFEELHGVPLYTQAAYPASTGSGILLGLSAGGYLWGREKYAALPGLIASENRYPSPMQAWAPLNAKKRKPWELLVNSEGERFVQEDHPSVHHLELEILRQKGHRHWAIFDSNILENSPPMIPDWNSARIIREAQKNDMFCSAMELSSLALRAGLNPRKLKSTVEIYNAQLSSKSEDPFGRKFRPAVIQKPPFYAIQMQGWTLVSFAGLAVNARLEVVDPNGRPIPNLFALGEVIGAGATSGKSYVNGMLVTPAITFGRILGSSLFRLA